MFAQKGFEETKVDDIADQVGVSRRTLFRYFRSKNDIPWGQFDQSLAAFRATLAAQGGDVPVAEAVRSL